MRRYLITAYDCRAIAENVIEKTEHLAQEPITIEEIVRNCHYEASRGRKKTKIKLEKASLLSEDDFNALEALGYDINWKAETSCYDIAWTNAPAPINKRNKKKVELAFKDIDEYILIACEKFDANYGEVVTESRKLNARLARMAMYSILYNKFGLTLRAIGEKFNRRDHSTINNGLEKCQDYLFSDRDFKQKYVELKDELVKKYENQAENN